MNVDKMRAIVLSQVKTTFFHNKTPKFGLGNGLWLLPDGLGGLRMTFDKQSNYCR